MGSLTGQGVLVSVLDVPMRDARIRHAEHRLPIPTDAPDRRFWRQLCRASSLESIPVAPSVTEGR